VNFGLWNGTDFLPIETIVSNLIIQINSLKRYHKESPETGIRSLYGDGSKLASRVRKPTLKKNWKKVQLNMIALITLCKILKYTNLEKNCVQGLNSELAFLTPYYEL
jgi:hypothetical protein